MHAPDAWLSRQDYPLLDQIARFVTQHIHLLSGTRNPAHAHDFA